MNILFIGDIRYQKFLEGLSLYQEKCKQNKVAQIELIVYDYVYDQQTLLDKLKLNSNHIFIILDCFHLQNESFNVEDNQCKLRNLVNLVQRKIFFHMNTTDLKDFSIEQRINFNIFSNDCDVVRRLLDGTHGLHKLMVGNFEILDYSSLKTVTNIQNLIEKLVSNQSLDNYSISANTALSSLEPLSKENYLQTTRKKDQEYRNFWEQKWKIQNLNRNNRLSFINETIAKLNIQYTALYQSWMIKYFFDSLNHEYLVNETCSLLNEHETQNDLLTDCIKSITILSDSYSFNKSLFQTRMFNQFMYKLFSSSNNEHRLKAAKIFESYAKADPKSFMDDLKKTECVNVFELVVSLFESAVTQADLDNLAMYLKVEFVEIICNKFYDFLPTIPGKNLAAYVKLPVCVFLRVKEQKLTDSLFGLMSRLAASIESIFNHLNFELYTKLDVALFELASVLNSFAFKALNECTRNSQLKLNVWNFIRCINSIYTFAIDNIDKVRDNSPIPNSPTSDQHFNFENQLVIKNTTLSGDFYNLIKARMPEEGMLFDMETNLLSVLRIDLETLKQKLSDTEKQSKEKDVKISEAKDKFDRIKLELDTKCDEMAAQNETINHLRTQRLQERNRSGHQVQLGDETMEKIIQSTDSQNSLSADVSRILANIRAEYANLDEKIRKSFKGMIRNIISLNSSRTQFVYEIIQNADDCQYDETTKGERLLSITLGEEYILVASNQKGFTRADVESLCSISCSNKLKGKHIGHKGIGWKSVFSFTNMPHVYSNDWRFYFKKNEQDRDEMAYLCPFYLEDPQVPPALKESVDSNRTFFYFPLKDCIVKDPKVKRTFCDDLTHNLNPFVLLFTQNLTHIVFNSKCVDNLRQEEYNINKKLIGELRENVTYEKTRFKKIYFYEVTLTEKTQKRVDERSFYMVNCELSVPDDIIDENDTQYWDRITCLSIAFPTNDFSKTYDIFSFMPICNLGLKFVINAHWSLVTSRESIVESSFNDFLKDSLADLFGFVIKECPVVKKNIHNLLSHTNIDEDRNKFKLWHRLIGPIKEIIKRTFNDSNCITRLVNKNLLEKLHLDAGMIESRLNIRLIDDANLSAITENEMTEYGLQKLHLNDLLDLPNEENFNDEWWREFFSLCLENHSSGELNVNKAKESKLFFTKQDQTRTRLPSIDCHWFVNNLQNASVQTWLQNRTHHPVNVIDYKSDLEKKFLLQVIDLPELTLNKLFDIIHFELHMNEHEQACNVDNVWHDLELVKNNVKVLSELKYKSESLFAQSLLIPTVGKPLTRCKYAKLANILGYRINGSETNQSIIDFGRFDLGETLKVRLDWERFFLIHLNCQLIEMKNVQEKSLDELLELLQHKDLLVEMLAKLNPESLSIVKNLPIKINEGIFSLSNLFRSNFIAYLPTSVNFPDESVDLAELLGINTKLTAQSCANVLRTLVRARQTDTSLYIEWFRKLFNIMSVEPINIAKDEKLIYLEHENDYFRLDDIFFTDDELLVNVCKHARKPVINAKTNACYLNIQDVLIGIIGLKRSNLKLDDMILAINNCKNKPNLVNYQTLTQQGFDEFMNLYGLLEQIILDQLNITSADLKDPPRQVLNSVNQDSCEKIRHSLCNVQLVMHNRQLKSREEMPVRDGLFTCRENEIIQRMFDTNKYSDELKANCYFVHSKLTKISPYLLELLNVKYIEYECVLKLHHKTKRVELTSSELNNLAAGFVETPNFEIILVDHLDNSIEYLNCFRTTLRKKDEITDKSQLRKVNIDRYNYAIYDDKWLYLKLDEKLKVDTRPEYQNTLKFLFNKKAVLLTSAMNYLIRKKGLKKHVNQLHQQLERKNLWWKHSTDHANASADRFNLDDVIFNLKESIHSTLRSCNTIDIVYRNRLLEFPSSAENIDLRPTSNEGSWRVQSPSTALNMKYNFEIGAKAEAYFKVYLDTILGLQMYADYEWVSSNNSDNLRIDDSLGYDFKIFKSVNAFSPYVPKTCYVEVKGTNRIWNREIRMSSNEFDFSRRLNGNESVYVLIIVENVGNPDMRIVRQIDLTSNRTLIRQIKVEQYVFEYVGP